MPYIEPTRRYKLDSKIDGLEHVLHREGDNLGDLNYAITRLLLTRFYRRRRYVGIVEVTGTLVCVLLEFYMRHARKYEDERLAANGDVQPTDK